MAGYGELMTAIIKKQMAVMGDKVALQKARDVSGIKVDDSGNITAGASKEKLSALVDSYKSVAGGVAVMFAKKAIAGKTAGVNLPDELK